MNRGELVKQFFQGNIRALAKILTLVEARQPGFEKIMSEIAGAEAPSFCLGVTGPPGAGKSTLADCLIHIIRKEGLDIGIVAIDPSSPFTGGAVLGDRIRMQDHAADSGVFIRSLGSRGSHGGLSRATRDIVRVMSSFGFNYIIVETVGVGQTELDIMELADTTIVVLVPEAGDTIQTMKAGLTEIADIFVVNKCDRPGADEMVRGLTTLVEMNGASAWTIPVVKTQATHSKGMDELYRTINRHKKFMEGDAARAKHRREIRKAELIQITLELFERNLREKLTSDKKFSSILDNVLTGSENPYSMSQKILKRLVKK